MSYRITALLVFGLCTLAGRAAELPVIELDAGSQQDYVHPRAIKRVAVGDPKVATVVALSPRSLLVTAKRPGATTLAVWDAGGDAPAYRARIVVSGAVGPKLKLSGAISSLERHAALQDSLAADSKKPVDTSVSNFDVQVQIDIKVVEVSRQRMMESGLLFSRNTANRTAALGGPGNLSGVEGNGGGFSLLSSGGFLPFGNAFNFVYGSATSGFLHTLSALEANGFAYTLAEPSLTALSGQTASFLAGGEIPIPMRTGSGADSSITITFKEFGIRLSLTPTVLDNDRIFLRVAPEVSELDSTVAVQTGGVSVPGLRVRRAETSVALGDGESFVISGLVSRNTVGNIDKFPGLGDLPILGAFFRSTRFDRQDKEMLMVATTHLVRPLARNAKTPPLPGENYRAYDPSFLQFMFQEKGKFDSGSGGFSN